MKISISDFLNNLEYYGDIYRTINSSSETTREELKTGITRNDFNHGFSCYTAQ
jgi:hypothetical protein